MALSTLHLWTPGEKDSLDVLLRSLARPSRAIAIESGVGDEGDRWLAVVDSATYHNLLFVTETSHGHWLVNYLGSEHASASLATAVQEALYGDQPLPEARVIQLVV